jgi:hypothetical protein
MAAELKNALDEDFRKIGEFGNYQFIILVMVGLMASQAAVLDYGYAFISATPEYRYE